VTASTRWYQLQRRFTVTITAVPVPDFTFSITNTAINVSDSFPSGSATLNVAMVNGFSQVVSFGCSGPALQQSLQLRSGDALCQRHLDADGGHRPCVARSLQPQPVSSGKWRNRPQRCCWACLYCCAARCERSSVGRGMFLTALLLGAASNGNLRLRKAVLLRAKGTSTVVVTATAGSLSHTASFTLNVQ